MGIKENCGDGGGSGGGSGGGRSASENGNFWSGLIVEGDRLFGCVVAHIVGFYYFSVPIFCFC